MRLLLVEDHGRIRDALRAAQSRHELHAAAEPASEAADDACPPCDVILMDVDTDGASPKSQAAQIRARYREMPLIAVSADPSIEECIELLDVGADDYVGFPFRVDELEARARAICRRYGRASNGVVTIGALEIDLDSNGVSQSGERIVLRPKELAILHMLAKNRGRVLSKERMESQLYLSPGAVESNTVEVHIHRLRQRFGAAFIRNIRGMGYVIPLESRSEPA